LPEAVLPPDMAWARGNPHLAGAFARFDRVLTATAASTLASETGELVKRHLAEWHGELPRLDMQWVDDALGGVLVEQKPLARLALLAAFAPTRVSPRDIENAQNLGSTGADLIGTVAWAAFAAARRVGRWLS